MTAPTPSRIEIWPFRRCGKLRRRPGGRLRRVLVRRGYSQSIHDTAWALLLRAAGYRRAVEPSPERPEAAAAIAVLDEWDEPSFRVARAALLSMPVQRDFVFRDLSPARGAGAVVSVRTFLDRLDELENGKDRKATRKADHAALKKLAERGVDQAERARLRELIAAATALPAPEGSPPPEDAEKTEAMAAEQREAKRELWALHTEWSEVARADIRRRDYLIQLGLAAMGPVLGLGAEQHHRCAAGDPGAIPLPAARR